MADNIIRNDIVQVDFKTDLTELTKLNKEIDELRKSLKGDLGDDAFDDLKDNAKESTKDMDKLKDTVKKVGNTSLTKLTSGLKQIKTKLTDIGKKAAVQAYNGLKKVAGVSFKMLGAGLTATATALGAVVAKSVTAFADYEQLVGGVETLFGTGGLDLQDYAKSVGKSVSDVKKEYDGLMSAQGEVFKNANNAYKTAGLSANEYMDTVTSFSASLISSLKGDTEKAASVADMAISDMSDNANKMGTPMESIIETYQSLAKGNFAIYLKSAA